ncbi:MAG TPA: hypothetical protein VGS28_05035 [Candidatus Saccharimonadales bacterium]|nr:hypothetical protein [Candidatus Saccharimonadales bacterium]
MQNKQHVTVSGIVTENGKHIKNAQVTVTCDNHTKHAKTSRSGYYTVTFQNKQCKVNSSVTVSASKGSESGQNIGKYKMCHSLWLNVALTSVAVPEFGLIEGVIAAIMGSGAFLMIRRRNQRATI